jgi:hypothetical protein
MRINRPRRRFPSPALIIACLALFAALGGSTYAATYTGSSGIHWTNAKLKNGWTTANPVNGTPGYAKDSLGVVHLRGSLASGVNATTAFVLPKGLRPTHDLELPAFTSTSTSGAVGIDRNGDVVPFGSGVSAFTSLGGLSFVAGQ